jgi:hypothetical protein
MAIDSPNNEKTKENFNLLCEVQIILGLATILPLLQFVHNLNKFN